MTRYPNPYPTHQPEFNHSTQLKAVLGEPMVAQLCVLLEAGLLHMSMASQFGEMQRKAASEQPLVWWHMDEPVCTDRPASITRNMTQPFFGLAG